MADYGDIIQHTATISLPDYRKRYQHIEKFLGYCKQCRNYGQQWVCPPFGFSVQEFLKPYSTVYIIGYQLLLKPRFATREYPNQEERNHEVEEIMAWARDIIDPQMRQLEEQHPNSLACYPGSCKLCPKGACTRLIDKPCIHPDKARHSLENFGFDLSTTASDLLGIPMLWSEGNRLARYYLLVAGLLR